MDDTAKALLTALLAQKMKEGLRSMKERTESYRKVIEDEEKLTQSFYWILTKSLMLTLDVQRKKVEPTYRAAKIEFENANQKAAACIFSMLWEMFFQDLKQDLGAFLKEQGSSTRALTPILSEIAPKALDLALKP